MKPKGTDDAPRREPRTGRDVLKDYPLRLLWSALQKDIRRGKEREVEALFWAAELETINPTGLWNKLVLIASEDIGPANDTLPANLKALRASYEEAVQKKRDSGRLFLAHAVLLLSRSKKSRVVDDMVWTLYFDRHQGWRPEIPEYAHDHHTGTGTVEDWIRDGSHIENEAEDVPNPYREQARENLRSGHGLGEYTPRRFTKKEKKSEAPSVPVQLTFDAPLEPDHGGSPK